LKTIFFVLFFFWRIRSYGVDALVISFVGALLRGTNTFAVTGFTGISWTIFEFSLVLVLYEVGGLTTILVAAALFCNKASSFNSYSLALRFLSSICLRSFAPSLSSTLPTGCAEVLNCL